jgi:predicted nucleotidyltransferase
MRAVRAPGGAAAKKYIVPNYAERCGTRLAKLQAGASAIADYCATKRDIVAVFAFGSFARGRVHPWSDLDLLIVRETSIPHLHVLRELLEACADAGDAPPNDVREGALSLEKFYVPTRYPDALGWADAAVAFTRRDAEGARDDAGAVVAWADGRLASGIPEG